MGAGADEVDELARELFHKADATGLWSCADHGVQLYFRKEAVRKLQQSHRIILDESA